MCSVHNADPWPDICDITLSLLNGWLETWFTAGFRIYFYNLPHLMDDFCNTELIENTKYFSLKCLFFKVLSKIWL